MSNLIKSLHIDYKDGSNPFCVIAVDESIIRKHIEWQKKHNGSIIKSIYVTDGISEVFLKDDAWMSTNAVRAKYFATFNGNKYYRDSDGYVYTRVGDEVAYCSRLKRGSLTEDKAEPSYPVKNVLLVDEVKK